MRDQDAKKEEAERAAEERRLAIEAGAYFSSSEDEDMYGDDIADDGGVATDPEAVCFANEETPAPQSSSGTYVFSAKGLSPSQWYRFRVSARNENGFGPYTLTRKFVKTLPRPPRPSTLPPFISGKGSRVLNVEWEAANGFGESVLAYELSCRQRPAPKMVGEGEAEEDEKKENEDSWDTVCRLHQQQDEAQCGFEVHELRPGCTYEFRLRAQTCIGWGEFGPPSRPVQCLFEPPAAPDAPTCRVIKLGQDGEGDASASQNSVMVRIEWDAPDTYGLDLEAYELQFQSKQNLNAWGAIGGNGGSGDESSVEPTMIDGDITKHHVDQLVHDVACRVRVRTAQGCTGEHLQEVLRR